jgi:hypothetical protein
LPPVAGGSLELELRPQNRLSGLNPREDSWQRGGAAGSLADGGVEERLDGAPIVEKQRF